jgi:histidinol-phosphate aminotransferase
MNATRLAELLEQKHGISKDHFIFGNGSFELISLIGNAYLDEGDEAIYTDPSFGWYINATTANQATLVRVPVNEHHALDTAGILRAVTDRTKVIWICNPNNPTGTLIPKEELLALLEAVADTVLIVLDEAYIDFVEEPYFDTVSLVREHDNVILLRSFSKTYGLASFRIGYGIACPDIIEGMTKVKLPINTSHAAQVAAIASLEDEPYKEQVLRTVREERLYYYQEFEALGFDYVRSNGNFILVHTGYDGAWLEQEFLKRGIMLRKGGEFGEKYRDYLRISVGTPQENRKVIAVMKEIINEREGNKQ